MVVFALFAHRGMPYTVLSAAGLLAAAVVIGLSLRRAARPGALLGFAGGSRVGLALAVGIAIGVAAGLWQRSQASVPHEAAIGLPLFVVLACLIGIAEEVVYRGWMQGRLAALGWPAAVLAAAVAHAAYKTALFVWPPDAVTSVFDLGGIALWTVLGGLMLGGLRALSGSVLPAMAAHAVFDAVVYSAYAKPPWWVWG